MVGAKALALAVFASTSTALRVPVAPARRYALSGGCGSRRFGVGRFRLAAAPPADGLIPPSLNARINAWGLALKQKGVASRDDFLEASAPVDKAKSLAAAGALFGVFVAYRAYRGFFVVLPAVFTEVRDKMRTGVLPAEVERDIDPKTGELRARSALLMNLGACVFTAVLLIRTLFDGLAVVFSKLGSGAVGGGGTAKDAATGLSNAEAALDLPPLPDIPDIAIPDTDEIPLSCCD